MYMESVCIGHVLQVPFNNDVFMLAEIQTFRDWDVIKIIKEANKLSHPDPLVSRSTLLVVAAVVIVVAGIVLTTRRQRREKETTK
jgi:hypothetical protein